MNAADWPLLIERLAQGAQIPVAAIESMTCRAAAELAAKLEAMGDPTAHTPAPTLFIAAKHGGSGDGEPTGAKFHTPSSTVPVPLPRAMDLERETLPEIQDDDDAGEWFFELIDEGP